MKSLEIEDYIFLEEFVSGLSREYYPNPITEKINKKIQEGYIPVGNINICGVHRTSMGTDCIYVQAMVKYKVEERTDERQER